jgi:ParB-like chromosome segregation protein Spo0J
MEIKTVDIDSLFLDKKNARKHDVKNLAAIKGSLTQFGQQKPIVVDNKNVIIAGNGTFMAAKDLGWKSVKVVVSELDSVRLKAYALADNKTSDMSFFDDEILKDTLAYLSLNDFDITEIGFDLSDLDFDTDLDEGADKPEKYPVFKLEIIFNSQDERDAYYAKFLSKGLIVKVVK